MSIKRKIKEKFNKVIYTNYLHIYLLRLNFANPKADLISKLNLVYI